MADYTIETQWPLIAITTSGDTITFPRRGQLYHTGHTTDGDATMSIVVVGRESTPAAADYSAEADKIVLHPGATLEVQPGTYQLKSESGTIAVNAWVD